MHDACLHIRAPAKINLWLYVGAQRADGYHEVDTAMAAVSIFDQITLKVRDAASGRRSIRCRVLGPEAVAPGAENLAAQAAKAVLAALDCSAQVSLLLHKVIPSGAGLGGGSSDAAAVLRYLPGLLGRRLSASARLSIATGLGADVPFFLHARPVRALGIGEKLQPLAQVARPHVVVVVPERRVDTSWAYRAALPRLTSRKRPPRYPRLSLSNKPLDGVLYNEFERGVSREVPDIQRLSRALRLRGATATVMSGSGSAVVGMFADGAAARSAVAGFPASDRVFAARVLASAPRPVVGR